MKLPGVIRPLIAGDAPAAFELFRSVVRLLPAGFLTKRSPPEFDVLTGRGSCSAGYFEDGRLRAYALGRIAAGTDTGAHRQNILRRPHEPVGVLQGTVVHPDQRGLGLHGGLYTARLDLLVTRGATQHMGIVFLPNLLSLEANLKCGLLVRGLIEDADGLNFLVYVDTQENVRTDEDTAEWIAADDVPRIDEALRRGLRGWSLRRSSDRAEILFSPPLP